MNDLERMQAARAYLSDPQRWSKGTYTKTDHLGFGVTARCAMAALQLNETVFGAAQGDMPAPSVHMKLASALPAATAPLIAFFVLPPGRHVAEGPERPESYIAHFNDSVAGHHEILAMFDRAIETEQKRVASPSLVPEIVPELVEA